MRAFTINGKAIDIFLATKPGTPIIYLNTFFSEGQKVYETAQAAGCPPFTLVAISDLDWNHDMVPWDSSPAFKNTEPCTGGSDDYLRLLTEEIISTTERNCQHSTMARNCWGFSGRALCTVCHLPAGPIFTGW